jgi:presenilin-like A22 family membrane protease
MDPKVRAVLVFAGATAGAVVLHQVATREAAQLGLPHVAVGALTALIDYGS